ncbi:MAG: SdpA family antimicrobial peptide system protein [Leucobacter sp.]
MLVLLISIPSNSLIPSSKLQSGPLAHIQSLVPQGWAFFTKPASEPRLTAHSKVDGEWVLLSRGPNAEPHNAFGADRSARTEEYEMNALIDQVPDESWVECMEPNLDRCSPIEQDPMVVKNQARHPIFCGDLALKRTPPVPWLWRADVAEMEYEFVRLDVTCVDSARRDE